MIVVMMKSDCCQNYMCHICALSYSSVMNKKRQQLGCHYCQKPECKYIDVDVCD